MFWPNLPIVMIVIFVFKAINIFDWYRFQTCKRCWRSQCLPSLYWRGLPLIGKSTPSSWPEEIWMMSWVMTQPWSWPTSRWSWSYHWWLLQNVGNNIHGDCSIGSRANNLFWQKERQQLLRGASLDHHFFQCHHHHCWSFFVITTGDHVSLY